MIDLGLQRVWALLKNLGNPQNTFRAVHVAGTNGKGSVCAYIESGLRQAGIKTGSFNSPHLVYKGDCVRSNGHYDLDMFLDVERFVKSTDSHYQVNATEFELLTATAFEMLRQLKTQVAVIEVGLGGRLDATNVLTEVDVSVITRVGQDHEQFLGSTLAEIAREKAGIIKPLIPVVVDGSNQKDVLSVVKATSQEHGSALTVASADSVTIVPPLLGTYQRDNLACALAALDMASQKYSLNPALVSQGLMATEWPGRLQWVERGHDQILLDGAHNLQAAQALSDFLAASTSELPRVYVVAFTDSKDYSQILQALVRPDDTVVATSFGPVDGMPWVRPADLQSVGQAALKLTDRVILEPDVQKAQDRAQQLAAGGACVVCGSLYLVGDVLRAMNS